MSGANAASAPASTMRNSPSIAALFLRRRSSASCASVRCFRVITLSAAARSCAVSGRSAVVTGSLPYLDTWIEEAVHEVDRQVGDRDDESEQEEDSHDHGVVTLADAPDELPS